MEDEPTAHTHGVGRHTDSSSLDGLIERLHNASAAQRLGRARVQVHDVEHIAL